METGMTMRIKIIPVYLITLAFLMLLSCTAFGIDRIKADSLMQIINNTKGRDRIKALNELGYLYLSEKTDQSLRCFDEAYKLSIQLNDRDEIGNSLLNLGIYYKTIGEFEKSLEKIFSSQSQFIKSGNNSRLISCLMHLSEIYKAVNDFKKALVYYQQVLKLIQSSPDKDVHLSDIYQNMGDIFFEKKNYNQALNYYFKSLAINKKTDNKRKTAYIYRKISDVYIIHDIHSRAIEYFKKALDKYIEMGDRNAEAECLSNIGLLYSHTNQYNKSIGYLHTTVTIYKKLDNKIKMAESLVDLASVFHQKQDYDSALVCFDLALSLFNQTGNFNGIILTLNKTAILYKETGEFGKALVNFNKSISCAKMYHLKSLLQKNYLDISETFTILKEYNKAYEYLQLANQIKDTLISEETARQKFILDERFRMEKKEKEIERQKIHTVDKNSMEKIVYFIVVSLVILLVFILIGIAVLKYFKKIQLKTGKKIIKKVKPENQRSSLKQGQHNQPASLIYANPLPTPINPLIDIIHQIFPHSFIYFNPLKNTGGDFYWFEKRLDNIYFSMIDCSVTGIPLTFLSHVIHNIIHENLKSIEIKTPADILNNLNIDLSYRLHKEFRDADVQRDLKMILCRYHAASQTLEYAGSSGVMFLVRQNEFIEFTTDTHSLGSYIDHSARLFNNYRFNIQHDDILYIFTDGYYKQLTSLDDHFTKDHFRQFILDTSIKPVEEQRDFFAKKIEEWENDTEQVDDILIIGIKF